MASRDAGTIFISLQLATQELQAGIRKLDVQFKKIGSSAQQMGSRMSLAIGAPLAAIGGYAVKSFADFDRAMQNTISIMDKAGEVMRRELIEGAIDISKKTAFSAKEAADGYYALAASGLDAERSIAALPVVSKFATAGFMDMSRAAEILTGVQIALNLKMEDPIKNMEQLARVGDVLAQGNIDTTGTIQDFSNALSTSLAGAMRDANVSLETGVALLETYAQANIKGQVAGTNLAIVIRALGINALKYAPAFKKLGVDVFDPKTGARTDMIKMLKQLEDALKSMSDAERVAALQAIGFKQKNQGAVVSLLGFGDATENFRQRLLSAGGALNTMAEKQLQSFSNQMAMAWNRITAVAIVIGSDLAPIILTLTSALAKAVEVFQKIPKPIRMMIEGFAALAVVIAGAMWTFGIFVSGIGALIGASGKLTAALTILKGAFLAVFAPATFGPALLIAGFATLAVAIYTFWDDIKGTVDDFLNWFADTFPKLTEFAEATWIVFRDGTITAWDAIVDTVDNATILIASNLAAFGDYINANATRWWNGIYVGADSVFEDIKTVVTDFTNWLENNLPYITNVFKQTWQDIKDAFDLIFSGIQAGVTKLINGIRGTVVNTQEAAKAIVDHEKIKKAADVTTQLSKITKEQNDAWNAGAIAAQQNAGKMTSLQAAQQKAAEGLKGHTQAVEENVSALKHEGKGLDEVLEGMEKTGKAANKAGNAMDQLRKKLDKALNVQERKPLDEQMKDAIDNLDQSAFNNLQAQIAESIRKGSEAGLADLVKKAGPANAKAAGELAKQITEAQIQTTLAKNQAEWERAEEENARKTAEKQKEAYEDAVSFYEDIFDKAINGTTESLSDRLKDVAIGFGAALAAAFGDASDEGIKDFKDLGKVLAEEIAGLFGGGSGGSGSFGGSGGGGGGLSDLFNQAREALGFGRTTESAHASGVQGPGLEDGTFGEGSMNISTGQYISGGIQAVGAALNASDKDKANKDNSGTGAAIGAAIGTIWGPIGTMVGSMLGEAIGGLFKWGSQDPEEQARHAFANFIEEGFEKLKTFGFFDSNKKFVTQNAEDFNFIQGSADKFNDGTWADRFHEMGAEAEQVFTGLGEAMKQALKLDDADGAQLGFLLGENLSGNIDNARLLVQQLGLSLEDLSKGLMDAAKAGDITWQEWARDQAGLNEAFKPGLVAVGDLAGALEALHGSAGRGIAALKAVRDIGVEAGEKGAKSLEDLRAQLVATGRAPEEVENIIRTLQQNGITTMEQLANASDEVAGNIVAGLGNGSKELSEEWANMGERVEKITKQLEAIPQSIQSRITLRVDADLSDDARLALENSSAGADLDLPDSSGKVKKFAKGGYISRALSFGLNGGVGVAGEAGGEFLMPAARLPDGTMGVRAIQRKDSQNVTQVVVNAPGAAPGSEHRIMQAVKEMHRQMTSQVFFVVDRGTEGGGRRR